MTVAVRLSGTEITDDGRVGGHDAGATLVRRLLRVFPGSQVVGEQAREGQGFTVVPLEEVRGAVVVNMDVLDSPSLWHTLHRHDPEPRLMNFVWWHPSMYDHPVELSSLALSCALFPTFCNSERTATEVRETVAAWTAPHLYERTRTAWVNLGVRLEHAQPRREPPVPVVLYPAISLAERKRPELFLRVVERVAARTPIRVEARLVEAHLVSEGAMALSRHDWSWVGPLTASRQTYWEHLSRTTAFLATAWEESYGLEYVEALVAGAVGVFPDRPWVWAIVPPSYPFVYRDADEAEAMLHRAVTDTAACRREMDRAAGGDLQAWLWARHDDDVFDRAVRHWVAEWFPAP
ncbi:glycosyltransferase family 1 protein [Georgenia sp. H159]|uniref:glycosyltransferase family 1 protein n=1 Tax=Georgenia sp. H159 TaxID=3076115 RepID=UPI002D7761BD|nr:glycosyltransferase family 1 protein [Georgenia sp. H159]